MSVYLHFHPVSLFIVLAFMVYFGFLLKNWKKIALLLGVMVLSFVPVGLFEIKHSFPILNNLLVLRQYDAFVENTQISGDYPVSSNNVLENLYQLFVLSDSYVPAVLLLVMIVFLTGYSIYKKKHIPGLYIALIPALVFAAVARTQLTTYYGLPYFYSMFVVLLVEVVRILKGKYLLMFSTIIGLVLVYWISQTGMYSVKNSYRAQYFSDISQEILEKSGLEKQEKYNLFYVSADGNTYPHAYQLREFMHAQGFISQDMTSYAQSDVLLIFSDREQVDLEEVRSWEIDQFLESGQSTSSAHLLEDGQLLMYRKQ